MGGGCVCDNYISNYLLKSKENAIHLEKGHSFIQQNSCNKISNKTSILYNILENKKDIKALNKRYSDFHNFEHHLNTKNIENKISINEGKNTSFHEATFINQKNNNITGEDNNKKIFSNNNSSNYNGSTFLPTGTKGKSEEENNNINNNIDNNNINNNIGNNDNNNNNNNLLNTKHNIVMTKIKNKRDGYRKSDTNTNFNCNLGENNFIFINISRGSSILNKKDLAKFESTTPKMMIEKEHFEEITKGKKNLFSHFCHNRLNEKTQIKCNNQIITSVFKLNFDMNKYCEEMLNIINSIRKNPEYLIKHIDYLIENNIHKSDEGIFLISQEIDEKIKLMDNYIELFDKTKNIIKEIINTNKNISQLTQLLYQDDLEIILDESNNNENDNENEGDYNDYNEKEEEESFNDIKNLPLKLNLIYDEDINIDDADETDIIQKNYE